MGESAQGSAGISPGATAWPATAALSALLLLAACSDDPVPTGNVVIVAPSPTPSASTPMVTVTPAPVPATPTATTVMRPQKTFVDPPLPAELRDDGGLAPLPPPPGTHNQQ